MQDTTATPGTLRVWRGWCWWLLAAAALAAVAYPLLWRDAFVAAWLVCGGLAAVLAIALRQYRNEVALKQVVSGGVGVLFSAILTLALCEAAARAYLDPFDVGGEPPMSPHPALVWALEHGKSGARPITLDDGTIGVERYTISSQGLRDPEWNTKQPGEFRIALLGDSFTFGKGLQNDETISRRLTARLQEQFGPGRVTAINGGCGGYGPWQSHGLFIERILPLEPDLVVLQLHLPNDVADTIIRDCKVPPAYERLNAAYKLLFGKYFSDARAALDARLHQHSRLYKFAFQQSEARLRISRLFDGLRWYAGPVYPPLPESAARPHHLEIYRREWPEVLQQGWTEMVADIESLQETCNTAGIPLVVYSIPNLEVASDGAWHAATEPYGGEAAYQRNIARTLLEPALADSSIPYIDVEGAMRSHEDVLSLYFINDGHLNPDGANFVAESLAKRLAPFVRQHATPDTNKGSRSASGA